MPVESVVAIGSSCLALVLLVLVVKFWRDNRDLSEALDHATQQLEHLQLSFHRFVPQDVVENIIQSGVSTRGERRDVTVLFTDLEDFTSLSETLEPEVIVRILNGYFRVMSSVVREHHGFVVRFLGDGILAMFGAPEPNPWHVQDAARAAVEMRSALRDYSRELEARGDPGLQMGVGIETGPAMVGVLGSQELMEYTAVGDVVNTAARIETLTRENEHDVLISQRMAEALDERFLTEALDPLPVKGKREPLHPYGLLAVDEEAPEERDGEGSPGGTH